MSKSPRSRIQSGQPRKPEETPLVGDQPPLHRQMFSAEFIAVMLQCSQERVRAMATAAGVNVAMTFNDKAFYDAAGLMQMKRHLTAQKAAINSPVLQ